jgi:GT2 family glycosyltransferase
LTEAAQPVQADRRPSVSVVIVTYRRPEHVRTCLQHVFAQTCSPAEVIIVDASPDDDTRAVVIEVEGPVQYLRNDAGAGTTATSRRIGLQAAVGDIVVFFDDDAYAEPDCIEELLRLYDDPGVGGVGGRAINDVEPEHAPEGAGSIGMLLPNGTLTGNFDAHPGRTIAVDHLLGANMSWRRRALLDAGGIHDLYPGTCLREETDIALRVRAAGWKIRFTPFAVVRHVAGPYAKGKRFDRRYTYYANRNHVVLLAANLGWKSPEFRRFFRSAAAEVSEHLRRAVRLDRALRAGGVRAALRALAGGMTRPVWIAAGLVAGLAAAAPPVMRGEWTAAGPPSPAGTGPRDGAVPR